MVHPLFHFFGEFLGLLQVFLIEYAACSSSCCEEEWDCRCQYAKGNKGDEISKKKSFSKHISCIL